MSRGHPGSTAEAEVDKLECPGVLHIRGFLEKTARDRAGWFRGSQGVPHKEYLHRTAVGEVGTS